MTLGAGSWQLSSCRACRPDILASVCMCCELLGTHKVLCHLVCCQYQAAQVLATLVQAGRMAE